MAAGQHFKVLKGKKTDKSKVKDKSKYDKNFDSIFRKKNRQEKENEN